MATYLQNVEFCALDARTQTGDFGLDACVDLLDLESMYSRLVTDSTLFQIQVEPYTRGGSGDLLPQSLLELLYICHEPFVLALHQGKIVSLEQLEFRFESGEIDFLRVVGLVAFLTRDETLGEIGDALVDDVAQ